MAGGLKAMEKPAPFPATTVCEPGVADMVKSTSPPPPMSCLPNAPEHPPSQTNASESIAPCRAHKTTLLDLRFVAPITAASRYLRFENVPHLVRIRRLGFAKSCRGT